MSRHLLARLTLLLGVVALGLVVLPAMVYDQPPFRAAADKEQDSHGDDRTSKPPVAHRFNVKINKFEFAFGKATTQPSTAPGETPLPTQPPPPPPNPVKPYQIGAVVVALLGLITGPTAWTTARRSRPLVVSGMTCCCVAITWHYVVAGLVIGVAVAILLFILGAAAG
ncbi:MAG: hypothetical protein JWN40_1673 [Phycisphaerales bacterium]|nr:hypothetical protein [Phycisphaerales bacterium]